jgi:S1-C subfamily serine protease
MAHARTSPLLLAGAAALLACSPLAAQDAADPENVRARVTPIVQVVRKVGPTVVNVYANLEIDSGGWYGTQQAGSLGSGVIIHPSGLVVTNAHVITGNVRGSTVRDLAITYRPDWGAGQPEMKKFRAKLLGFDRTNDLALLQIQSEGPFQAAKLGRSNDLMVGETVLAVGNPLGREGSVTHGIVSATHRNLASPTGEEFDDLIQTDAPLNSGNSGGPLFNILGELIGINEAIAGDRQFGRAEGQGLAIPVDRVRSLLESEFNPYVLRHAWLGMDVENAGGGVQVKKVERDGPASRAGIQVDDVIRKVGTYDVTDRTSFNLSICAFDSDDPVPLALQRGGKTKEAVLTPVSIDDEIYQRLGARLAERPAMVAFTNVSPNGPAGRLGLMNNDLLAEFDGREVTTIQEVFETLREKKPGDRVQVAVRRYLRGQRKVYEGELKL